jgi:hypothetical protein
MKYINLTDKPVDCTSLLAALNRNPDGATVATVAEPNRKVLVRWDSFFKAWRLYFPKEEFLWEWGLTVQEGTGWWTVYKQVDGTPVSSEVGVFEVIVRMLNIYFKFVSGYDQAKTFYKPEGHVTNLLEYARKSIAETPLSPAEKDSAPPKPVRPSEGIIQAGRRVHAGCQPGRA